MAKPSWIELELARQTLTLLGVTMPTPVGGGGMAVGDLPAALTALGVPQPTPAAGLAVGDLPAALTALGVPQPTPSAAAGGVCVASVLFNGQGTLAIRKAANVSSVTDNGAGDYTVNFTAALADANYRVAGVCRGPTSVVSALMENQDNPVRTTSALRLYTLTFAGAPTDMPYISVLVFN